MDLAEVPAACLVVALSVVGRMLEEEVFMDSLY